MSHERYETGAAARGAAAPAWLASYQRFMSLRDKWQPCAGCHTARAVRLDRGRILCDPCATGRPAVMTLGQRLAKQRSIEASIAADDAIAASMAARRAPGRGVAEAAGPLTRYHDFEAASTMRLEFGPRGRR